MGKYIQRRGLSLVLQQIRGRQAGARSRITWLPGQCSFQSVLHPWKWDIAPDDPELCWPQEPLSQMPQHIPVIGLTQGHFSLCCKIGLVFECMSENIFFSKEQQLIRTESQWHWDILNMRISFLLLCVQTSPDHFVGGKRGKALTSPHGDVGLNQVVKPLSRLEIQKG